ncbi:MAG TPA: hypothetical protein VK841_13050 [Polyangiaceae bacterium]|nr:hypothetical protein [Polyangiaceae bacterium]
MEHFGEGQPKGVDTGLAAREHMRLELIDDLLAESPLFDDQRTAKAQPLDSRYCRAARSHGAKASQDVGEVKLIKRARCLRMPNQTGQA